MNNKQIPDIYYCGHLVAFIDILGQSSSLNQLKQIEWWKLSDETKTILKGTYGSVLKFRKIFRSFVDSFSKESVLDKVFQALSDPNNNSTWDHYGESRILLRALSDSLILTFPLNVKNGLMPLKSIFGVFGACASGMLLSLNCGFAVRGAIEIGPCIYDSGTCEVYGSALNDAVKYEKDANWPRILIGPQLIKYLENCASLPAGQNVNLINIGEAKLCLSGLTKDDDGSYYIDFLAKVYHENVDPSEYQKMVDKAVAFIQKQIEKFNNKPNVLSKYSKLHDYISIHKIQRA